MPPADAQHPNPRLLACIGPGILFAAAAIGVSHLVQATRAGAVYGLSLIGLIILAHAMKLPAMLFGPRYATATGHSLLHAYRQQGRLTLAAFAAIQVGTMFTIQAAVTLVTAALVRPTIADPLARAAGLIDAGESTNIAWVSAGILVVCAAVLSLGGFRWLDRIVKLLMVIMAVTTIAAAALCIPRIDPEAFALIPAERNAALVLAMVALVGWMPAPLDISVWHSQWTLARRKQTGHAPTKSQCELDFFVGYGLCVVLAIAFVVLGTALMFGTPEPPPESAGAFANTLIRLYTESLGAWSGPLIATCAVAVMFSTTITVLDAIPRTTADLIAEFRASPGVSPPSRSLYWIALAVLALGGLAIIARFLGSLAQLVVLATTLSFLGTPLLAWFNHRAMTAPGVAENHRPSRLLLHWSRAAIFFWIAFALVFLVTRLGPIA